MSAFLFIVSGQTLMMYGENFVFLLCIHVENNQKKKDYMSKSPSNGKDQKQRYTATVKALRSRNFKKNLPFLILSDKLPDGQVYREFPDGRIEVQQVFATGSKFEVKVLHVLGSSDADKVREEYELF
ncbi:MAG: hypothetical protein ABIN80_05550 [Dyadobacter sp.]|uniref:hypothetical protein n=1 Tax=Dyadobacter sp. TaxID=1914288 RepID=UPI0032673F08